MTTQPGVPTPAPRANVLSRREVALWAGSFLAVSLVLVVMGFTSRDPDSALYAALATRLAEGPVSHWIAPEWWGHWGNQGLFREHPIGIILAATMLGAIGVPASQAAYIVGLAAGLASILLIAWLVARLAGPADGRVLLILLQFIPMAFIFRIRSNHEYPMLVCLLVALIGIDAARRSWRWTWVTPLALCVAVLVKGAFVAIPLLAVGWWLVLDPRRVKGSAARAVTAVVASVAAVFLMSWAYEVAYRQVTGESFWGGYWARQLGPLKLGGTTVRDESVVLHHLGFYALRLLWHPAPWTLALVAVALRARRSWRTQWNSLPEPGRRGVMFVLAFAASTVLMLAPASRYAERYLFSPNYALAALGIVVSLHTWPRLRELVAEADRRVPALPVLCWTVLVLARLLTGQFLPRIT